MSKTSQLICDLEEKQLIRFFADNILESINNYIFESKLLSLKENILISILSQIELNVMILQSDTVINDMRFVEKTSQDINSMIKDIKELYEEKRVNK